MVHNLFLICFVNFIYTLYIQDAYQTVSYTE